MEKLKMHSPNLTEENIAKLRELFPGCVTEAKDENGNVRVAVDFDQLRQELSGHVVDGPQERYHLNWPGKREALVTANSPIAKTLRPAREESVDFDATKNLFIEGDNLDALKILQETYLGQAKVIYIDPPYNTGSDLIYHDDFSESLNDFIERTAQKDSAGNRLVANTESNGRFHSDWLSMIYPRLRLAKKLLASDGIICVSISDAELHNLRSVLDEVFGERNYINTVNVLAKVSAGASGGGEDKRLKKNIEYVVIYARSFDDFNTLAHLYTERPLVEVIDEMREDGESWKYTSVLLGAGKREHFATVKDGEGNPIEIYKRGGVQRSTIKKICADEKLSEAEAYEKYFDAIFSDTNAQTSIRERVIESVGNLEDGEILEVEYVPRSGKDKNTQVKHTYISNTVRRVIWLSDVAERGTKGIMKRDKLGTFWSDFDYNNVGKEGGIPFPDGKKPIDLLRTCISLYRGNDGVFVDFFAGSASFPHAVLAANALDGGTRRFVAVNYPEEIDTKNKKYEAAVRFYREIGIPLVITEIAKERIRRSGVRLLEANHHVDWNKDVGFRVLKIDTSNMAEVRYTPDAVKQTDLLSAVDNIKPGRDNPEDLLFQVLVDWGVDLSFPIRTETVKGKTVFFVNAEPYDLIACFDKGVTEDLVKELAKHKPMRVVFRDNGFESDAVKINVDQIFRQLSPSTDVKSI